MIYTIPLFVSCLLAMWFCYWATGAFSTLRNRTCRIACFVCPVVLSALLIAFPGVILNPLGDFTNSLKLLSGRDQAALTIFLVILLLVPTLLLVNLVAQTRILNHRKSH